MNILLEKVYQPQKTEKKIYRLWEKTGYFNPDKLPARFQKAKSFCIIMPPPNANDPLHIGHAVFVTLQDIMIRFQRLRGKKTLWLPGTDHAGFETQVVFEKKLAKEGKSRFSLGQKKFAKEIYKFTQKNKKIVRQQLKMLGASCDWSREKFTLDKKIVKIVYETFEKLWQDGLLYHGERIVNYCPRHQTAFSDLEVKYQEEKTSLYYIKYISPKDKNKFLLVATVRPETIPGDVALAVNPKDSRYFDWKGKTVIEPLTKREIPVITDKEVKIDFGSGVLKVTPGHDPLDFEIGKRNKLLPRETLTKNGRFNELAGPLNGLRIDEARQKAIEILQQENLLVRIEDYSHNVGRCYKCNTSLEPMIMKQWFINMTKPFGNQKKSLRDFALEAVKKGKIKIIPKYFEKTFFHWLKNIKDWNISRQIWWGIPLPVWYCQKQENNLCKKNKGIIVNIKKPLRLCPYCQSSEIIRDNDVLDTWFSSSQWPFATLLASHSSKSKITEITKDFKTFYPTSVMETGWDILFFWVARMIMLGIYRTGKIPFKIIYLHGLVRDKDRQKMSKSKGNVIDPLGVAQIYGTDALRMALTIGNTAGVDTIISEEKIRGYRNFANKIWNASRFVISNLNDYSFKKPPSLSIKTRRLIKEFNQTKKKITSLMENFKFSLAAEILYHYFWHTFADKIIEQTKSLLRKDKKKREENQYLLYYLLTNLLKMLHPFMPFITETIWQTLPPKNKKPLIIEKWPS